MPLLPIFYKKKNFVGNFCWYNTNKNTVLKQLKLFNIYQIKLMNKIHRINILLPMYYKPTFQVFKCNSNIAQNIKILNTCNRQLLSLNKSNGKWVMFLWKQLKFLYFRSFGIIHQKSDGKQVSPIP